ALRRPQGPALSEARRKDEPAGPQVLRRDLARVLLVQRREMIETHAVQLHLEQLVHGQLAARVRQADHYAVHVARADDGWDVLNRPDHTGIQHGRTQARRVRVDKPDNFDSEIL